MNWIISFIGRLRIRAGFDNFPQSLKYPCTNDTFEKYSRKISNVGFFASYALFKCYAICYETSVSCALPSSPSSQIMACVSMQTCRNVKTGRASWRFSQQSPTFCISYPTTAKLQGREANDDRFHLAAAFQVQVNKRPTSTPVPFCSGLKGRQNSMRGLRLTALTYTLASYVSRHASFPCTKRARDFPRAFFCFYRLYSNSALS